MRKKNPLNYVSFVFILIITFAMGKFIIILYFYMKKNIRKEKARDLNDIIILLNENFTIRSSSITL